MSTHLITGAGSGIGAVLADRLQARRDQLVLLARDEQRAKQLATTYDGAEILIADLADPDAVDRLVLPDRLDSVLHVAGVIELAPVAEMRLADLREQLDVNLVSPTILTRLALPALRRSRGLVLFVNSSAALGPGTGWPAYCASKTGLRAMADVLRLEELEHEVRVTTVFPSRTATPMQEKVHEQEGNRYDSARWIQPSTVADTILHVIDLPLDATISEVMVRPLTVR